MGKARITIGSALVDYVLPTAVVGIVVGFGLFTIYRDDLLTTFISASTNSQIQNGVLAMNSMGDSSGMGVEAPGETAEDPVAEEDPEEGAPDDGADETSDTGCVNGVCTMSFKGVSLTGIPEDFAEFIETSGPASGTQTLAELVSQVAEVLSNDETVDNDTLALLLENIAGHAGNNIPFRDLTEGMGQDENLIGNNSGMAEAQLWIERDLSDGNSYDPFYITDLSNNPGSEYSLFKDYYDQALVEIQSMAPSPQTEQIESLLVLLAGEIQGINSSFITKVTEPDPSMDEIKAHVASTSTDIRAQLINILGE